MKKLTTIILLLLILPNLSFGQTLTTKEMLDFIFIDLTTLNSSLTTKGWNLEEIKKGDDQTYTIARWCNKKNPKTVNGTSYLQYFDGSKKNKLEGFNETYLVYIIYDLKVFNDYKKQFIKSGFKEFPPKTKENEIWEIYGNIPKKSVIAFRTSIVDGVNVYSIQSYCNNSHIATTVLSQD